MIYVLFLRQGFSPWHMKVNARCIARQRLFSLRFQQHSLFNCCTLKRGYFRSILPILCSTQNHSQKTDVKLLPLSVVAQNSSPLPFPACFGTLYCKSEIVYVSVCVYLEACSTWAAISYVIQNGDYFRIKQSFFSPVTRNKAPASKQTIYSETQNKLSWKAKQPLFTSKITSVSSIYNKE